MSNLVQTSFDYDALSPETRFFVQEKAFAIHARLKRTAEDIVMIGKDLKAVQQRLKQENKGEERQGHGHFIEWTRSEFEMSERTAFNFMAVAERFGEKTATVAVFSPKVLYELATKSEINNKVIEQIESGQTLPTLEEVRNAKEALKKAEEAEREARQEAEVLQQQLLTSTQATIDAQEQASRLTKQIEQLHQEITTISTPQTIVQEKEVTPPEVKAQLERLHQKIITLTEQRNNLSEEAKRLGEEARAVTFQRNEQKHHDRTREQWRRVSGDIHTTLLKLITHLPSPVDTQVFEAEDWTRLTQTTETVGRCLHECRRLESRIQMIVDSE